jgi:predicted nucleotidyltransferase component of viral defense system
MKEHIRSLLKNNFTPVQNKNLVREYLQARILEGLQRAGAMVPLAFCGGTALRFMYNIPRFSEDLDFTLEGDPANYDFRGWLNAIQIDFRREGYRVDVKVNDQRTVQAAFVRFDGLLHDLNLSPHANEALSIKIEVDTRPPAGAVLQISLVRRHVTLRLQHHDRASLLSGKLHAILQREFAKGRDLYDLLWYLSDRTWDAPNLTMLANALEQTNWQGEMPTPQNWRDMVARRIEQLDWQRIRSDVLPFLERPQEMELLTLENLLGVIQQM